jgi:hypothetical protein
MYAHNHSVAAVLDWEMAAGALPPDSQFALSNPGSVLLADLIGAPTPVGATENVLGPRA